MRVSLTRAVVAFACASLLLTPALASAQRRGGGGHGPRGGTGPRGGVVGPRVAVTGGALAWGTGYGWGWGPGAWWGGPFGPWGFYDPVWARTAMMSSVRVQVQPVQTQVFVDGYFAGVADDFDGVFQRLRLDPGQHIVELYLPGHQPVRQDMLLTPGDGFRIRHVMQPLPLGMPDYPRPQPTFTPQPPAGGWTSAPQPPPMPPVTVGPPVPMAPPMPTPQSPAPMPLPPVPMSPGAVGPAAAQGFGSLVVRAQPGDADILIDGEVWRGTADALTVQLSVGRHRVEVRRQGFESYSTTVDVQSGQPVVLNVSLLRDDRR